MNTLKSRLTATASLFTAALWLAGCRGLNHAVRNGPLPHGESVVFGSIAVPPAELSWAKRLSITVINTQNSKPVLVHPVRQPAAPFYWSLPPGHYAILDLQTANSFLDPGLEQQTSSRRIYAQFAVPSVETAVYVGALDLTSSAVSVVDDFDTAVRAFHTRFPSLNLEPTKQLLILEKQR
jgi:hypothetical protein